MRIVSSSLRRGQLTEAIDVNLDGQRELAVGVDLIEVGRVSDSLERQGKRFLDRIFTEREQDYCNGRATSLAGRFAIKEAVAKALGTGIGDVEWKEIEVECNDRGQPTLRLHGAARDLAAFKGFDTWSISLTHTDSLAIGFAVALARQK